jgi:3-hydroxymyristoyl/3-hydroxydecanoyl-(acyl carrier protein) dehydratase
MLDRVDSLKLDGGAHGLGFITGSKRVDPDEWFFHAHFRGDPVTPGSLGVEAFLQLLRVFAERRWPQLARTHRIASPSPGGEHRWCSSGKVDVQATIASVDEGAASLTADGLLACDGKVIYSMHGYRISLVPEES